MSAHVAVLVKADWLFLMTDVDYLYTANPKIDTNAQPIYEVRVGIRMGAGWGRVQGWVTQPAPDSIPVHSPYKDSHLTGQSDSEEILWGVKAGGAARFALTVPPLTLPLTLPLTPPLTPPLTLPLTPPARQPRFLSLHAFLVHTFRYTTW